MKKYELTSSCIKLESTKLFQIRALMDFSDVRAGDMGGYIESEDNLAHTGNSWVFGNALVLGPDSIFSVSGIGSQCDTTTFFLCQDRKIRVSCGCFFGDLEAFAAKVQETHGDNRHGNVYRLAIEMAKQHIPIPDSSTLDKQQER